MDLYKVFIKKSAEKELKAISNPDMGRIIHKIQSLIQNPRPLGSEKLSGEEKYRVRQGDWRIIYGIDDFNKTIEIVKLGHRREIYR